MKPWRPFWKKIEASCEQLLKPSPNFEIAKFETYREWVAGLTFIDLMFGDDEMRRLIDWMIGEPTTDFMVVGNDGIRLQLYLRCCMGLDFCRERIPGRKTFDWNQDERTIYKFLLTDQWRSNALYWLNRCVWEPESPSESVRNTLSRIETKAIRDQTIGLN